jgi:hypothetical protein
VAMAWSPDTIQDATVLGPIKAKPFGWPRKTRPALTGPARGGCEIWRSRTEECSRRGSNQRMDARRARKPAISNRWI